MLLIAGSRGMAGAAVLSALGALRSGVGLLTVGIVESARRILTSHVPEAMTLPLPETKDGFLSPSAVRIIKDYVRQRTFTILAVGPGLGTGVPQRNLVLAVIRMNLPVVVDADGLNNIHPKDLKDRSVVITPHPGELARLMGISRQKVQKDRVGLARNTAKSLGVICVLKGHRTVISDGRITCINPTGNPAMATGGMGDVLTGVIAGLLAQGLPRFEAACAGVYLHGLAGDMARVSDRGLLATELAAKIPYALKKI
jgi:NAD(P)H-hydrate epimerase